MLNNCLPVPLMFGVHVCIYLFKRVNNRACNCGMFTGQQMTEGLIHVYIISLCFSELPQTDFDSFSLEIVGVTCHTRNWLVVGSITEFLTPGMSAQDVLSQMYWYVKRRYPKCGKLEIRIVKIVYNCLFGDKEQLFLNVCIEFIIPCISLSPCSTVYLHSKSASASPLLPSSIFHCALTNKTKEKRCALVGLRSCSNCTVRTLSAPYGAFLPAAATIDSCCCLGQGVILTLASL